MTLNIARASEDLLRLAATTDASPDFLTRSLDMLLERTQSNFGLLAELGEPGEDTSRLHVLARSRGNNPHGHALWPTLRQEVVHARLTTTATNTKDSPCFWAEVPAELVIERVPQGAGPHHLQTHVFGRTGQDTLLLVLASAAPGCRLPSDPGLLFLKMHMVVRQWREATLRESADNMLGQALHEELLSGLHLTDLLDHLPQGVICVDAQGLVLHASQTARRLLELEQRRVISQNHLDALLPPAETGTGGGRPGLAPTPGRNATRQEAPAVGDLPRRFDLRLPSGKTIAVRRQEIRQGMHILILADPLAAPPPARPADTGDRFQSELIDQARLADESRHQTEELLATVARQFLDPVRALRQSASRLLNVPTLARTELAEQLANIDGTAARLKHLVSNFVDYHLVMQTAVRSERMDVAPMLWTTAQEVFDPMTGDALEMNSDLPLVKADPALLQRAFFHMIQFSWAHRKPRTPLRLRVRFNRDHRSFALSDNGRGMEMGLLQGMVLRPPRAVSSPEDPGEPGGYCLPLARKIFSLHGGAFEAISITGVGTTFYFQLPLAQNHL